MRIEQCDPADEKTVRACHDVMLAAHKADEPIEPPMSYGTFAHYLRKGWEKTPGELWAAVDDGGEITGFDRMALPDLENLGKVYGSPTVHPAVRRRGIGQLLLRREAERATANGRTLFGAQVTAGSAGEAFAVAIGAQLDLEEVRRIQYLREIAPGTVASLRASAERVATGYSIASWTGPIPDEYCDAMAGVFNAFNDAPHGENHEPAFWDANRVRERTCLVQRAGLLRGYGVAALEDGTGEMAAFTGVLVDPASPSWGFQQLTAVTRAHRGHRLGLLVKTAMLELLAAAEPQVEWIQTGNAAGNEHMIAVNEQLGYRVAEPGWNFYEIAVSDIH